MRTNNGVIAAVEIGVLMVFMFSGAPACAQTSEAGPRGAPGTVPRASSPQNTETESSAPESESKTLEGQEKAGHIFGTTDQTLEADSRELAAPIIQFSISSSTVDFGGGPLTPQETPYTQQFTTTINSNTSWRISVSQDHELQGSGGTIPSDNFSFYAEGPEGKTTYQAPTGTQFGTDVLAVEGTRGSNLAATVTYMLFVPWSVEADNYAATHTYTAMSI